ncbi:hypothetical protein [Chitinophaga sp. YIM B06452]|uniref:hypothetical protein n=1 Tax=Chitinophaga sp. YIM B06452 TaxID=3082158 RepID=UPI0031FE6228
MGKLESKYKYNGYEQQNGEFKDGGGLEWYDYKNRYFDNQIGRFFCVDKLADAFPFYSTYQFAGNKVPNAIDLDGLEEVLTTKRLTQAALQLGVIGNKRVGELFERAGIAAVTDRNIAARRNVSNFYSPARELRNGPKGPIAVRPDAMNEIVHVDPVKKKVTISSLQFFEVKATKSSISRAYRSGQVEGMIDVLANRRDQGNLEVAELIIIATGDTEFNDNLREYANQRNVVVSVIWAGIDDENNVYFSDPFIYAARKGKSSFSVWNRFVANIMGLWDNKEGYPLNSFIRGITNHIPGESVGNPASGGNDPDPAEINDK